MRVSELERAYGRWVLVRRSLGLGSFGIDMVELPARESIPEHTAVDRRQQEVFHVVAGTPTMVVDGVDHPMQHGSSVRLDPELRRSVRYDEDTVARMLTVSAPITSGYEPLDGAGLNSRGPDCPAYPPM